MKQHVFMKESAMRRVFLAAIAAAFVFGISASAQAQTVAFAATLSGDNETPGVLTGAYAIASVTLDLGTQTVSWVIDVFNMPSGTNNAHFHVGGPGLAGPTVVNVAFPAGISNDYRLSGSATSANLTPRADQGIRSWEDFLQALVGGQTYLNIHSVNFPGGEIRGQVRRVQ
jgi:CHRD domain